MRCEPLKLVNVCSRGRKKENNCEAAKILQVRAVGHWHSRTKRFLSVCFLLVSHLLWVDVVLRNMV